MLRILPFLLLLPLLLSTKCAERRREARLQTLFEGRVLRMGDNQPIPGQILMLASSEKGSLFSLDPYTVDQSVRTDHEGKFSFQWQADENRVYKVDLYNHKKDYAHSGQIDYVDIGEERRDVVFWLAQLGTLALHLKNELPVEHIDIYKP